MLDFDLDFQTTDAGAPGQIIIVQVNFALNGARPPNKKWCVENARAFYFATLVDAS